MPLHETDWSDQSDGKELAITHNSSPFLPVFSHSLVVYKNFGLSHNLKYE